MLEAKVGNRRILRGTGDFIEVQIFEDGVAKDAEATPAVTVTIRKGDGTALVTDGATDKPADTTGVYRYVLAPGQTADVEIFTATWKAKVETVANQEFLTVHEIVGGFYASLAEIRSQRDITDIGDHETSELIDRLAEVEDFIEDHCGVAFVPRYQRDVLDGEGKDSIALSRRRPRRLLEVKIAGTTADLTGWALKTHGEIVTDGDVFTDGDQNVEVIYEHGFDGPPKDLRRVAIEMIRQQLLSQQSGAFDNATQLSNEFGTVQLAVAGPNRPTGVPKWDVVINRHAIRVPGVA